MAHQNAVYITRYQGQRQQLLRNVYIPAPTLVRVLRGSKSLVWRGERVEVTPGRWLALSAGQSLTFVNQPGDRGFESVTLSFLAQPPGEWLIEAVPAVEAPCLAANTALAFCFDALVNGVSHRVDETAQQHLALALFAQLRQANKLTLLFPGEELTWRDRVARFLMADPGAAHSLEAVAQALGVSRATLHRRLKQENSSFRQVLADIRMGYSLTVLQKGHTVTEAAIACGYESRTRFAERFKQTLGVSPGQYCRTLIKPAEVSILRPETIELC
ncbi:helix-turn-helix transcriptional regulator [Gilvimarinus sp. 1_MG-2023]|uniref:helix-turn-helix transcriptional regulator n=1 Tax=Gilvimarinus sp. 1_MG-2023 TaxID=3062638 RepID=UPI0026E48069|nr:AraC family transcriptional regulator [Gilvimarinus sp. 1_MG-2023]MDO6746169.1 AraC family transcriptional regulator [Gilvimarinus sp. 1_MG-2023]